MSTGEGTIVKLHLLRRICADRNGATAIEYGLIVALIVIAIMGSLTLFGSRANSMWDNVSAQQSAAIAAAP